MKINTGDLENASWDARVTLNTAEMKQLFKFSQTLLQELDLVKADNLDTLQATFYGHEQPNSTREDLKAGSMPLEKVLANAQYADEFCFHVPKIIEE